MTEPHAGDDGTQPRRHSPFSELEAPADSSTGLTAEERRAIFIDAQAFGQNADIQKNLEMFGCDLSLVEFPEWQRTKHVHRLHPYLGKFIPQLVELFLRRFFKAGDTILDPFAGSGTTLVEASPLGIHSLGIELSAFNCLIIKAKTRRYDIEALRGEVRDAMARVEDLTRHLNGERVLPFKGAARKRSEVKTTSTYLKTWLAPRALQQILFYRSIIGDYESEDVLRVILSRATRSARLIRHFDLARPKKPLKVGEEYWCVKHKRICRPIEDALKFFRRYSRDTVQRIADYGELRTDATVTLLQGDARTVELPEGTRLDGVFTSPPYVGMIDYHDQHRYAYELFPDIERRDGDEIGPMALGKSKKAREAYKEDIATVFRRLLPHLKSGAKVFVVANDRHELYPEIGGMAALRLVDVFHRPVPMRTERDSRTYFESIFWFEPKEDGTADERG